MEKPMIIGVATSRPICASDIVSLLSLLVPRRPADFFVQAQRSPQQTRLTHARKRRRWMAVINETTAVQEDGGDLVLWILVWSELVAFGALLAGFMVMSYLHPESF